MEKQIADNNQQFNNSVFGITDKIKKEITQKISTLNQKLKELQAKKQIMDADSYYADAFEWRFEFPQVLDEKGDFVGFDLVIGNPPYIQMQEDGGRLGNLYQNRGWQTFERTGDIYTLFYEQAQRLTKSNGYSSLITSNKWMRAGYGKRLRAYLLGDEVEIAGLYDLGAGVFESATVDVNILLFKNKKANKNKLSTINNYTKICSYKPSKNQDQHNHKHIDLQSYFEKNATSINPTEAFDASGEGGWFIGSSAEFVLKKKIETLGKPLKEWDIKINDGILTGYNQAFIIDTETRDRLCQADPKSKEIIKPILRGRDIKRYSYSWAGLWMINTHNGYGKNLAINVNDYPAIKKHLDQFGTKLAKRSDKGQTPYNLRNCAYLEDFEKEKIVWNRIASKKLFSIVDKGVYVNDSMHFFTGSDLYFLICILNSKLYIWLLSVIVGEAAGGNAGNTSNISNLFVFKLPQHKQKPFIKIIEQIITRLRLGKETTDLER